MKSITALLPMKGHSERVPNKNLKQFAGRPLYHAILDTLLKVSAINKVLINSDSELIKKNLEDHYAEFGSKIIFVERPLNLQGDFVSMNKIIEYDINYSGDEYFLQTHSTNPLLKPQTIAEAIDFFFNSLNQFDSVFGATKHQTRFYTDTFQPVNHNPQELIRTQDLDPLFEENSNFYIFSKSSFANNKNQRIGKKPYIFPMNKYEAIDIDDPEDFQVAELLYRKI